MISHKSAAEIVKLLRVSIRRHFDDFANFPNEQHVDHDFISIVDMWFNLITFVTHWTRCEMLIFEIVFFEMFFVCGNRSNRS